MMSEVPTLIDYHLHKLGTAKLVPFALSNNNTAPSFQLKEDNLMTLSVKFTPAPICFCSDYVKSKSENLSFPVCYHILYVLINYYRLKKLSICMFHKLPPNYFEKMVSYFDNWLISHHVAQHLRKRRKKKPYNFTFETSMLMLDVDNSEILNPMWKMYSIDECAICLDSLSEKKLDLCSECFNYSHSKCSNRWRAKRQGCHLCRDNPTKYNIDNIDEIEEFPDLLSTRKK